MVTGEKLENIVQRKKINKMKITFFDESNAINKNAIGSGVYKFVLKKGENQRILYIGKSYSMISRCANHIYELEKDNSYFGLTPKNWVNKELEIIVDIYEQVDTSQLSSSDRDILLYEKELEAIKIEKPLAQSETSDRLRGDRVKCVQDYLNSLNYL